MSENTENKSLKTIINSDEKQGNSTTKPEANKNAKEYGGRKDGLDPTRFGDWEKNGRCIDF